MILLTTVFKIICKRYYLFMLKSPNVPQGKTYLKLWYLVHSVFPSMLVCNIFLLLTVLANYGWSPK